jgi:hypothetical protein
MDRHKGGDNCDFTSDDEILSINSPQHSVGGPYIVVHKNTGKRWALVALEWEGQPRLGIRWFYETAGHPISSGWPIWFILPEELNTIILDGLDIEEWFREIIDDFLSEDENRLSGPELAIISEVKSFFESHPQLRKDTSTIICCFISKKLKKCDAAQREKADARKIKNNLEGIIPIFNNAHDREDLMNQIEKFLDEMF